MGNFPVVDGVTVFMAAPEGYKVDLNRPERRHVLESYIICGFGLVLAFLFLIQFRYVKLSLLPRPDGEVACLGVGWMFSVAVQVALIRSFSKSLMGVHAWEMSLEKFNYGSNFMVLVPILYAVETGFTKRWKWSVYSAFFLVVGYHTAIFFAVIFGCRPIQKHWTVGMEGTCINRPALYIATVGLGILSDLVLLVLPMPMILRLQMPSRQKAGLVLLFTIGSATLVTSIVRLILLIPIQHSRDSTWVMSSAVVWVFVEANLLIICASLIGERGSSTGYHLSGSAGGYKHPFKVIGNIVQRRRADKFGTPVEDGAGFDLDLIGHAPPTLIAVGKGGEKPEKVIARHLRKQESINKIGDSGSEVQMWNPQFASDEVDAERAILQTTTVTVKYHCRRRGKVSMKMLRERMKDEMGDRN
ncbi:hypothetical protein BGZ61DRAFT_500366 [Ilyonectria robusta]|uniref:uncharacterized protein n=1 Tax=Ilyonectria robusta TaxID=1079257 RepID=UPI001E8E1E6D|nr:uncharacterized protein BGZ61DRAFT_500366 [Ilyonectria robusta]KAH8655957.1 hypothetical protein BGZ61DRAFT_500366 [Ilyonectria robusta]